MATPASVLSTLIKVQGMETASAKLNQYDSAGRKAAIGADKASAASDRLGRSARGTTPHLSGMVKAAAGAVGVFAAFSAAKDAVNYTVALSGSVARLTAITGMDAKQASLWIETMKVRGVETKAVSIGFITLARNMRAATNGSAKAAGAFKELGISQEVLKSGDMNDVLLRSADAFAKMRNPAERAALAQQLFGRQAQALIPFLSQGRKGVEGALAAAERYGAYLPKNVDTLNKAREAQRNMNLAMDGVKIAFATSVMPALVTGAQGVMHFIAQMRSGEGVGGVFAHIISTAFNFIKGVVSAVIGVVGTFIDQIRNGTGIGGAFASVMSSVAGAVMSVYNFMKGLVQQFIAGNPLVVALTGAVAGLVIGFVAYRGIMLAVRTATAIATAVQIAWNAVLTANPIGIVVVAIAAFVGAIVALYIKVAWFRDAVNAAWAAIQTTAETVFPIIQKIVSAVFTAISWAWNNILLPVFDAIKWVLLNVLVPIWTAQFNIIKGVVIAIFNTVGWAWNNILKPIFTAIGWFITNVVVPIWTTQFNILKTIVTSIFNAVGWAWNNILKPVFNAIHTAVQALGTFFGTIFTGIKNGVVNAFNAIKGFVDGMFNALWTGARNLGKAIANPFIRGLNWVLQKGWDFIHAVVGVINSIPIIPNIHISGKSPIVIPEFAKGGKVTTPGYFAGEEAPRHPEYIVPTNPAYRGRALGLFGQLGKELGITGFQTGGIFTGQPTLSQSQLESLWKVVNPNIGDPKLMAAIAMAESGGRDVVNNIGATGYWQIHPGGSQYLDPIANAREAGFKLATQGLKAWEAYTNGSYKQYLGGGGGGGVLGFLGGLVSGGLGILGDLLSGGVNAVKDMMPKIAAPPGSITGIAKDFALGTPKYIIEQSVSWVWKQIKGIFGGGGTGGKLGSTSPNWDAVEQIASSLGLASTGPGQRTRPGDLGSYHGIGRARDFSDSAPQMLKFARMMDEMYGGRLLELIHTPLNYSIKNGQRVAPYAAAGHFNHVHVAFANGGMWPGGWGVVGERGPELANFPGGTRIYSNDQSRTMLSDRPMVNIEHLEVRSDFDEQLLAHRLAFLLEM